MTKLLLLFASVLMFAACNNSSQEEADVLNMIGGTIHYEDLGIIVRNDSVISPRWVEEKRLEIADNDPRGVWAVWVYTVAWKGETYISFWNTFDSYIHTPELYDMEGRVVLDEVDGKDIQNVTRICPIIED